MKTVKQLMLGIALSCVSMAGMAQNIVTADSYTTTTKEDVAAGLTADNFPRISCSDYLSSIPYVLAADLFELDYSWRGSYYSYVPGALRISVSWTDETRSARGKITINCPNESYQELIDGNVDMVVSGRTLTDGEKAIAKENGVELLHVKIGHDALVFATGAENPASAHCCR